jgi:hypothetical protein
MIYVRSPSAVLKSSRQPLHSAWPRLQPNSELLMILFFHDWLTHMLPLPRRIFWLPGAITAWPNRTSTVLDPQRREAVYQPAAIQFSPWSTADR